jgi:hypothetical protein
MPKFHRIQEVVYFNIYIIITCTLNDFRPLMSFFLIKFFLQNLQKYIFDVEVKISK